MIKLPQQVTFFNRGFLINYFSTIKNQSKVIIDGSNNKSIDNDVKEVIEDFINSSEEKQIEVELIKIKL